MSFLTSPKQCFTLCLDRGEGGLCVSGVWKLMSYHGDLKKQCDRCPPPPNPVLRPLFSLIWGKMGCRRKCKQSWKPGIVVLLGALVEAEMGSLPYPTKN